MNSTTWAVAGPTREESRGSLQDLVGTPQFPVLPLQLGDTMRVHSGPARTLAAVDLRLLDPVSERLTVDPQLVRDPGDRPVRLPGLLPDLEHHPHGPLTDLVRVLLRCWHDSYLRKVGSLQRTRGGSTRWLAHKDRRRWHLHFIPTSSSWLNLIERWFKELTDKRLRRGRFTSVTDLTRAITVWAQHWNTDPKPFIWKATAEDIIAKVQRGRTTLHQIKTQTDH